MLRHSRHPRARRHCDESPPIFRAIFRIGKKRTLHLTKSYVRAIMAVDRNRRYAEHCEGAIRIQKCRTPGQIFLTRMRVGGNLFYI